MDPCCNDIIGGEVFILAKFPQGETGIYEGMGDIQIETSRIQRTAGASSNGSLWVTEQSQPARVLLSFTNRCALNKQPSRLFDARCRVDVTVVEKSRGIQHDFIGCVIVGMPRYNLSTGEVTGMELATDDYSGPTSYSETGAQTAGLAGQLAA
jgi:hypothetical protein